jgi:hypothetical protein
MAVVQQVRELDHQVVVAVQEATLEALVTQEVLLEVLVTPMPITAQAVVVALAQLAQTEELAEVQTAVTA